MYNVGENLRSDVKKIGEKKNGSVFDSVPIMRQPRAQPPPRPHSADFLEYEAIRKPQQQMPPQCEESVNQQRRPQRPKSSLDIVTPSDAANDGYFYSEER